MSPGDLDDPDYEPDEPAEPLVSAGYRTYEVYQRERVGQTTNLIGPRELISPDYLVDPYSYVAILRENYPCYRDWVGNRFWITRYDDVTSVFADEANYETRPKRWAYRDMIAGSDLGGELAFRRALTDRYDQDLADTVVMVVDDLSGDADLATDFAARVPLELLGQALGLDSAQRATFAALYWRIQRGAGWGDRARIDGLGALAEMTTFFEPMFDRSPSDRGDLISACVELDAGPSDLVATLLESDHETLHGSLANLWFLLLTNPEQLDVVRNEPRLMKFAYLEGLRHSPPIISASRFARHEVERFGRLLPRGAMMHLSAAAANRDPRQFTQPDEFRVDRTDLCQREPRGSFRADGLPAGVTFGHGKPSQLPAVPKQEPRSIYALTRDVAVAASESLIERWPTIALTAEAEPQLRSLRLGEMHTCWSLRAGLT